MESKEFVAIKAEVERRKQVAAGYQSYQDRLLREIELFTAHVGTKLASEVMMAAYPTQLDDEIDNEEVMQ